MEEKPGAKPRSLATAPMPVAGAALELRKIGVARFDIRDPYHLAVTLSWPAFAIGALAMLMAINVCFALLYLARPGAVANLPPGDFLSALFFSIETLATVGYGEMAPASVWGHTVAAAEIITGMAFTAIFTGLLFVRFSKPKARILFAETAIVAIYNGEPTLMVRIANGKLTMLSTASARLGLLMAEVSAEGQSFRRTHDLKLQRAEMPIFPLTWTVMHTIDAASPLAGLGAAELAEHDVRLFVMVQARDTALDAQVQAMRGYDYRHIAFGRRYADAISLDEAGRTVADLSRLSLTEPEGGDAASG
ncbi:MAG TPA: ion channel [Caulobacteraceae bacterium]